LRSLTLRLSTALEFHLIEQSPEPAAMRAFRRWNREGKRLRQALGPIRDVDVYLARLSGLQDIHKVSTAQGKPLTPICLREILKLENRLRHRRQKGIDELMVTLATRCKRLNRLSEEMKAALDLQNPSVIGSAAQEALGIFEGLALEIPRLDASNLHSFRKQLKRALYLSEISATSDPLSGRLAGAFRKIHGAVGKWHDCQSLADEAHRILPKHAGRDGLVSVMKMLTEEALQKALDLCRCSAAQVLKGVGPVEHFPPPKPVQNVSGEQRAGLGSNGRISK
jgi:CHAD domain-containing protein